MLTKNFTGPAVLRIAIGGVLVALAVDEWRENAQFREQAERARASVLAEVGANLSELEATEASVEEFRAALSTAGSCCVTA